MKRILLSFLFLCLLMSFGVTAYAANNSGNDTVIDTVVPGSHTITMTITGKGSVLMDGTAVGDSITITRHEDLLLTLTPDKGFVVDKVVYNGIDVTTNVLWGRLTLKNIIANGLLDVIFASDPKGDTPKTGDESNPALWSILLMVSSVCLLIVAVKGKKHYRKASKSDS